MAPLPQPATSSSRHRLLATFLPLAAIVLGLGLDGSKVLAAESPDLSIEASNKTPQAKLALTNVWTPLFTVLADASSSTDDGTIVTYTFDFGDKTPLVSTGSATALHTYTKRGTFKVKLVVVDNAGKKSSSVTQNIKVTVPPPDKPPTAKIKVTKVSTYGLTVIADGAGSTDPDATPIEHYHFDFGDGSTLVDVDAPSTSVQHTYAVGGKYTVRLIVSDTGDNDSKTVTTSVTVTPPPDYAPVARLAVRKREPNSLTVIADASQSNDTDATPIARYRFTFGDGTPAVETTDAVLEHTYSQAGLFPIVVVAIDGGGKESTPVTAGLFAGEPPPEQVAVYVGYYDTHHPARTQPKPSPWLGSSGVVFVGRPDGSSGGWDSSCLRLQNLTGQAIPGAVVTVDIGRNHYALWGTNTIPAGQSLILAQTSMENFDGSDTSPAGCYGCNPKLCETMVSHAIPVVHVKIGGVTTDYFDNNQVLNTKGVDGAGCPATGTRNDESHIWERVHSPESGSSNALLAGDESFGLQGDHWMAPPFPNPASGNIGVRFRTSSTGAVRLAFYDIAGRLVKTSLDGKLEGGIHNQRIDLAGAAPGIYFCDLSTPEGRMRKAFVVVN